MSSGLWDRQHMLALGCLGKEVRWPSLAAVPCVLPAVKSCLLFRALESHRRQGLLCLSYSKERESRQNHFLHK